MMTEVKDILRRLMEGGLMIEDVFFSEGDGHRDPAGAPGKGP